MNLSNVSLVSMLNPDLKTAELAIQFKLGLRLQIPYIFRQDMAENLYTCLEQEVPWGIVYIDDGRPTCVPASKLTAGTQQQWADIHAKVYATPVEQFQYLYNSYPMIPAYIEKRDPHLILHRVVEYLNSIEFLGFIRAVTGVAEVVATDAQATRYVPGCFLRKHSDYEEGKGREIAYVLNLTKAWRADLGGLLHFLDEDGKITDTYSPTFNTLSLFRVPTWHSVSYVVPYANRARYAITGWVRSGSPIKLSKD